MLEGYGITKDSLRQSVAHAFLRRQPANPLEWMPWHVRFPETWEATAFDFDVAPHVRGVIERGWLSNSIRKFNLQWATRLMKTSTLLSIMAWVACEDPAPMAVLFGDRQVLQNTVTEQLYPMFEATRPVRKVLAAGVRNRRVVRFNDCSIRLANAGTISDSSGYPARYVFKFEHEKIPTPSVSDKESDASKRIEKRTSGYARNVKICEEGSPVSAAESRVHKLRQSGSVIEFRYVVPCPHCREFQPLEFERVKWDRNEIGEQTPALAEKTARYVCQHCSQDVENHHRPQMMRAGKWIAPGEWIDADGEICGKPTVDSDTAIFGPLSKLYSLLISGWGAVAREFVEAVEAQRNGDLQALKNFVTETLGEVWVQKSGSVAVSELAEHLRGEHTLKECPGDTAFLVTTADVGYSGDDMLFHWMVQAWARGAQGAVVDFGLTVGKAKFLESLDRTYPVIGSGLRLPVKDFPIGLDSGKFTTEVYELVDQIGGRAIAMKGDSRTDRGNNVDWYSFGYRRASIDPRLLKMQKDIGEGDLLMMATERTQDYRIALTSKRIQRGEKGFVSFPLDLVEGHETYKSWFAQLTADYKEGARWQRSGANEAGDQIRTGRVLAEWFTKNGATWDVVALPKRFQPAGAASESGNRTDRPTEQNVFHASRFLLSQR